MVGDRGLVNPPTHEVIAAIERADGNHGEPELRFSRGDRAAPRIAPVVLRGFAWGSLAAGVWLALALASPTTTYHFAPLLVALAWPAARRTSSHSTGWTPGLAAAAGSTALVAVTAAMLRANGCPRRPHAPGRERPDRDRGDGQHRIGPRRGAGPTWAVTSSLEVQRAEVSAVRTSSSAG